MREGPAQPVGAASIGFDTSGRHLSTCPGADAGSGDARLDAARKRLLATPPPTAAAREQQWQKAVQKLRETEEMYLEECLRHEKKGEPQGKTLLRPAGHSAAGGNAVVCTRAGCTSQPVACPSLPRYMAGDMVKLTKSYNRWRECQDELALLERAPRKWLRHHGQYYTYGLRSHMNLLDHAAFVVESNAAIWPLWAGVAFIVARSVYSFFPRPPRH